MRLIDADELIKDIEYEKSLSSSSHRYDDAYAYEMAIGYINAADTIPQWHRCEDEMPNLGELVLCYSDRCGMFVAQFCSILYDGAYPYKDGVRYYGVNGSRVRRITHWMPLPKSPKE